MVAFTDKDTVEKLDAKWDAKINTMQLLKIYLLANLHAVDIGGVLATRIPIHSAKDLSTLGFTSCSCSAYFKGNGSFYQKRQV
jgi:hypothetical protein